MANFGLGITVASGFDLGAKAPLDSRLTVNTIEERDAHVNGNRAYEGMLVFVEADKKTYQLINGEWVEFGFDQEKLNTNLSPIISKNTEQDARLSALEGLVSGGEGEGLAAIMSDVAKNKTNIQTLQGDMANVDTKISNAKDEVIADAHSYADAKVSALVNTAPGTLDTLNELAKALGDDPNFSATITNQIGLKADTTYVDNQLKDKANTSYVNTELANKASTDDLSQETLRATTAEGALSTRVTALETKSSELTGTVETLTANLDAEILNRGNEITRVQKLVEAEKTRAEGVEEALQTSIADKYDKSSASTEQNRVNESLALKADISYVDDEIDTIEGNVNTLSSTVTSHGTDINAIKTNKADKTQVAEDISTSAGNTLASAKSYTDGEIKKIQDTTSALDTNYKDADATTLASAKSYTDTKVADLVNSAPETLNTLNELATALTEHGDEYEALLTTVGKKADLATVNAELANKANASEVNSTIESLQNSIAGKAPTQHPHVAGSVQFENDSVIVETLGGIKAGETLNGLSVEQILSKLLFKHVNHSISGSSNPNGGVFETGNTVTVTSITANVTKKTNPITKVEFLDGSNVLETRIEGVSAGGSFTLNNQNIQVKTNKNFAVRATANGENGQPLALTANTGSFTFVYPYYWGVVADGVSITQDVVKALTKKVETKANKSVPLTANFQKAVFAYPKSYGTLKQIFDPNNFDVTGTFTRTELSVTGLDGTAQLYYVYSNSAFTASNFTFRFNY